MSEAFCVIGARYLIFATCSCHSLPFHQCVLAYRRLYALLERHKSECDVLNLRDKPFALLAF